MAIGWLCGEYQRFYPHILVQKEIAVSEKDISESLKVVIYRVLQEALKLLLFTRDRRFWGILERSWGCFGSIDCVILVKNILNYQDVMSNG